MSRPPSRLRTLLEMLGAVRLGVVLMIVLAAVSVTGTIVLQKSLPGGHASAREVHYGYDTSRLLDRLTLTDVFHAPWYHSLMAMLAANLFFATLLRFSLRPRKLGFLLAHGGILVLLVGGVIYLRSGDKGRLAVHRGRTVRDYYSVHDVDRYPPSMRTLPFPVHLADYVRQTHPAEVFLLGPEEKQVSFRPEEGLDLTVPWDGTRLVFGKVLRDARRSRDLIDPGEGPLNPVARFRVRAREGTFEIWRPATLPCDDAALLDFNGRVALFFDWDPPRENALFPTTPRLIVRDRLTKRSAEVPAEEGRTFDIPGRPDVHGKIHDVLDDADNTTLGPMLEVRLSGDNLTEASLVPARTPRSRIASGPGGALRFRNIEMTYYRPSVIVRVVRGPDGNVMFHTWVRGKSSVQRVEMGQAVQVGPVAVTPEEALPRAEVVDRYVEAGLPTGVDAVNVKLTTPKGEIADFWISTERGRSLWKISDELKLFYQSGEEPSRFEAEVAFPANDDNVSAAPRVTIRPNHPAWHQGWQVFLSGTTPDGRLLLTVSHDPGLAFACVGLTMLAVGVFYASFVKPVILRGKGRA